MPSVEGVKMTLKKHQCQVIKALQHAYHLPTYILIKLFCAVTQ
jgi:hypothetical protein